MLCYLAAAGSGSGSDFQVSVAVSVSLSAIPGLPKPPAPLTVYREYKRRNNGLENLVVTTDLFNSLHSLAIAILTLIQCFVYDHDPLTLHLWVKLFLALVVISALSLSGYIAYLEFTAQGLALPFVKGGDDPAQPLPLPLPPTRPSPAPTPIPRVIYPDWIDLLYLFSAVKIIITCIQNVPQVYLNMVRKSTVGWAVDQVWLDLIGAVLSMAQLFIDAAISSPGNWIWSGVVGNPAKLGMGALSLAFDVLYLLQHYVFYPESRNGMDEEAVFNVSASPSTKSRSMVEEPTEESPLLGPRTLLTAATTESDGSLPPPVLLPRGNQSLPRAIYTGASETIQGPLGARIAFSPPSSQPQLLPQSSTTSRQGSSSLLPPPDLLLRRKSTVILAESLVGSADFKAVSWREILRRPSRMSSLVVDQGESGQQQQQRERPAQPERQGSGHSVGSSFGSI